MTDFPGLCALLDMKNIPALKTKSSSSNQENATGKPKRRLIKKSNTGFERPIGPRGFLFCLVFSSSAAHPKRNCTKMPQEGGKVTLLFGKTLL